jgi:glycerophosphoryl diester phosphodiesterase
MARRAALVATIALGYCLGVTAAIAFDLQGHRGARGRRPENTLPAFAYALGIGVATLELDLGMTRDGALVVAHDPRLNPDLARTPAGEWVESPGPTLFSLSFAEVARHDVGRLRPGTLYAARFPEQQPVDGARMPRLEDVFDLAERAGNREVRFNVEMKTDPGQPAATATPEAFADAVAAVVTRRKLAPRVTLQSFDWRSLARLRQIAPAIERSHLTIQGPGEDNVRLGTPGPNLWLAGLDPTAHGGSVPKLVAAAAGQVWSPDARTVTPEAVREAHALKLKVLPWTVNEPADMERLIEMGVDGLISDYPDRLRAVMTRRGMALPRPTPVEP